MRQYQGQLALTADVTTRVKATAFITTVVAISIVSARRGKFGAMSNRLDSTISNLQNMKASIETARGQVVDADFAVGAKLARAQILMQAQRLCYLRPMHQNNKC